MRRIENSESSCHQKASSSHYCPCSASRVTKERLLSSGNLDRIAQAVGLLFLIFSFSGCGTTTQRVGTEQLLISDAVDKAVSQIDFSHLADELVYLDTGFMSGVSTNTMVDAQYVTSSLRQQLTASGALVQEDRNSADIVVEPRIGALGTDGHDVTYGLPQSGAISSAAAVFSSNSVPIIPEISFGHSDAQAGIAKIIVFAYERETRKPVWQSGIARAESNSSNTWVLGAGPFQKGSIYDGYRFAGKKISNRYDENEEDGMEEEVVYDQPFLFKQEVEPVDDPVVDHDVQQASHEEDETSEKPVEKKSE